MSDGNFKTVRVVAAVLRDGDRIFATERGYGDWKDYWEFPGGKIENGETAEEALRREIREELLTEIEVGEKIMTVDYDYPAFHLTMDCFFAKVVSGDLTLLEHEAARWLKPEELDRVRWLPADLELIRVLKEKLQAEEKRMHRHDELYNSFIRILEEELRPAMGCTEPIAIAYAAAKARSVLQKLPERVVIEVSGNLIKNVKSVVVPHTGGLRGIPAAAAAGIVAGDENAELEVLSRVTPEETKEMAAYLEKAAIEVLCANTPCTFDLTVRVYAGEDSAMVRIVGHHTNIVRIEKNGEVLVDRAFAEGEEAPADRSTLTIERIVEFADLVDPEDVRPVLVSQIEKNMAIAEEGLRRPYGARIGETLLRRNPSDLMVRMRAYAAAGSDARMNGSELPVVINSGSGNQGITASVPLIVYARATGKTEEELLRALTVSNLVTIHLKAGIGTLSAYCGAVSAGCGAGAGLAYLEGADCNGVAHTVVNSVAINSGIICDGAKASCAAKIASSVEAGLMGYEMYKNGNQFFGGDGIVKHGVEKTIESVSRLAKLGMEETDKEIIRLMME